MASPPPIGGRQGEFARNAPSSSSPAGAPAGEAVRRELGALAAATLPFTGLLVGLLALAGLLTLAAGATGRWATAT